MARVISFVLVAVRCVIRVVYVGEIAEAEVTMMISDNLLRIKDYESSTALDICQLARDIRFFEFNSIGGLPEKIAVHFDAAGAADAWTTRENYLFIVLSSLTGLPLLLVWIMAGLPRLTKGRGQVPDSEYWFASDRQHATKNFLIQHGSWLGTLTVAVIYGMHILILHANELNPPLLAMDRFSVMIFVYLCGLIWWMAAFLRHFRKPIG